MISAVATGMVVLATPLPVRELLFIVGATGEVVQTDLAAFGSVDGDDDAPGTAALGQRVAILSSHLAGSPAIVGETLVAGDVSGYLTGIDVRSGALHWRVNVGGRPAGRLVFAENVMVVVSVNGTVTSFDGRLPR